MSNKKYDLIVVGDGLMANVLLKRYFESFPHHQVLQVSAQDLAPPVSLLSTAVVVKRNVKPGLSEFGDKLFQAHKVFLEFFQNYSGEGIEKCLHQTWCSHENEDIEDFRFRFPDYKKLQDYISFEEEGYLFYPEVFLTELRSELTAFDLTSKRDFIFKQKENQVIGKYQAYEGQKIFLGIGPYSAKWKNLIECPIPIKEVQGSYLKFPYQAEKSFSYTIDGKNFIYRKRTGEFIYGNSQFEGTIGQHDYANLLKSYLRFTGKLTFELPESQHASYCSGFRSKASKRVPHWGKNEQGNYFATGFWKNGYTLSFLAADQLVKTWINDSVN